MKRSNEGQDDAQAGSFQGHRLESSALALNKKAVALRYEQGREGAPKVTAKGKGWLAEQILERAGEHTVIWEDPALLEALYQLEVNQEIPESLYQLVAEVFAFVYRLDQKKGQL